MATDTATYGLDDWRALAEKALKGAALDSLRHETADGFDVEPIYSGRRDVSAVAGRRGSVPWTICSRVDHPDARRANVQALEELSGGVSGLELLFRDAPAAHGFGLPVEKTALHAALEGVHIDAIPLRIAPHPRSCETAEWILALADARGYDPATLDLSFGIDPVRTLARYGIPADGRQETLRGARAMLEGAGFGSRFFEADGRTYHDAGASDGQELAAVLATAVECLRALDEPSTTRLVGFTLAVDQEQFAATAKLRALRLLWRRVEEACGVEPAAARTHAETSWRMMSAADPHGNLLRATIAALAGGVGGADSLCVLPFNAARGLPDAFARRMARDTQLVLVEESSVHRVADPAVGSGAVEALTDALCETAWTEFQAIEREGGIVASLSAGKLQQRIDATRDRLAREVAAGERTLVGATLYPPPEPIEVDVEQIEPWPTMKTEDGALEPVRLEEMAR